MKLFIKESFDQSIPDWLRPTLSYLAKSKKTSRWGTAAGRGAFPNKVDASTTVYTPMPIPRTSQEFRRINEDENIVTVVKLIDNNGKEVIWVPGYKGDSERVDIDGTWKELSRFATKRILPCIDEYGYLTIGGPEYQSKIVTRGKNKPYDRLANAQYIDIEEPYNPGYSWDKDKVHGPARQTWQTKKGFDKSGYKITGIEKYKQKLAEMGLGNYEAILEDVFDTYVKLSSMIRLVRDNGPKREIFNSIMYAFPQYLDRLENYYQDYLREPDWYKAEATQYLKSMRGLKKAMDEFIRIIESGEEIDRETAYRLSHGF